jgi:hypothetical protein
MRAYLVTTGIVFALLVVAHLWRIVAETPQLATQPDFVLITLASAGLSAWAARLLWQTRAR